MKKFEIHPLWRFLTEQYSFEDSFQFFGPYTGASIFPKLVDSSTVRVEMPLVPNNTNIVGTHFGGSLYSMTDPWFMFLLIKKLGGNYIVWDKSARVDFIRPGEGTVSATFSLSDAEADSVRAEVASKRKSTRLYTVDIVDERQNTVAKEIYIRLALGSRF